jgi:hypothetical protein
MTTDTLTTSPVVAEVTQRVRYSRLWWVGLLAIVLSVVANLIVRAMALQFITVSPEFIPLSEPGATFVFTTVGVLAAVAVFALVGRLTRQPARVYSVIASIALLLSLVPNVAMLLDPASAPFPGSTVAGVIVLMLEHVVAAIVAVWVLTTLAIETKSST